VCQGLYLQPVEALVGDLDNKVNSFSGLCKEKRIIILGLQSRLKDQESCALILYDRGPVWAGLEKFSLLPVDAGWALPQYCAEGHCARR
jgi:hypothetical protein